MKKILILLLALACHRSRISDLPHQTVPEASVNVAEVTDAGMDVTPEAAELKHENILLIGDSEVLYSSWYFKPMRRDNETVYFDSKPGTTIGWWNGVFQKEMSKYHDIDVVIVFLGTNNFNFDYLQPHQHILDTLKASSAKCIWVGPTDVHMKGFTNPHIVNKLLKEEVSSLCTYVDTEQLHIELADGVHPTQAGAVKWLTEIWKVKDGR
jgi:hypothetical protein